MFARMDPTFFPCSFEPSMATMFGNLFFAQTEEAGRVIVEDVGLSETRWLSRTAFRDKSWDETNDLAFERVTDG